MSGPGQDTMVSSEVEVAVDPDTAFAAFTQELDLWWVRGPINHFAGGRALAMRCEPGVGGRLLEVYEDDALELGRVGLPGPGASQHSGRRPGPGRDGVAAGDTQVVRALVRATGQRAP